MGTGLTAESTEDAEGIGGSRDFVTFWDILGHFRYGHRIHRRERGGRRGGLSKVRSWFDKLRGARLRVNGVFLDTLRDTLGRVNTVNPLSLVLFSFCLTGFGWPGRVGPDAIPAT